MNGIAVTEWGSPGQVGIVYANGGAGYDGGGNGGIITVTVSGIFANIDGSTLSANGGDAAGKTGTFGSNGGFVQVNTQAFNNRGRSLISPNGGNGGFVNIRADAKFSVSNDNLGILEATGGNGGDGILSRGGVGGKVTLANIKNFSNGRVNMSAGHP